MRFPVPKKVGDNYQHNGIATARFTISKRLWHLSCADEYETRTATKSRQRFLIGLLENSLNFWGR